MFHGIFYVFSFYLIHNPNTIYTGLTSQMMKVLFWACSKSLDFTCHI